MSLEKNIISTISEVEDLISNHDFYEGDLLLTLENHVCSKQEEIDFVHEGHHPSLTHFYITQPVYNHLSILDNGTDQFPVYVRCFACSANLQLGCSVNILRCPPSLTLAEDNDRSLQIFWLRLDLVFQTILICVNVVQTSEN